MDRPLYDMLSAASRRLSLHMPGAQGKAPFGEMDYFRLDTTELPVTDDLYRPNGAVMEAQTLAAASAGAANTLLLHGGSTAGMHAMLLYAAKRGDAVILPRNVHISALHLCALAGLEPVFAVPDYTPKGRPFTRAESYRRAMAEHPEAKAVMAVRPDYYGVQCELEAVAREAHNRRMLVLCDEAHGAHFNWSAESRSALTCGADMAIQSAHKTLPALTAGAWLHSGAEIDVLRLRRLLRMVQTSSPSFINMLSLDDARAWMDEHGAESCQRLGAAVRAFHKKASALGYSDGQTDFPHALEKDPLRLVLDAPQGGFSLARALAAAGIDVEMADACGVVCILSLMDGGERLERLYQALTELAADNLCSEKAGAAPFPKPPVIPARAMPLSLAAFSESRPVRLQAAAGHISAGQVGLYPPGVALLTAGETITEAMAAYLAGISPEYIFGLNADNSVNCVKEQEYEQFSL